MSLVLPGGLAPATTTTAQGESSPHAVTSTAPAITAWSLPSAAFERYLLADDTDQYPMTYQLRLVLSGTFDVPTFERAYLRAVERHPLFAARIVGTGRAARWMGADPRAWIDVAPAGTPLRYPREERIWLDRETPVRIWIRTSPDEVDLRLQMHHSCADGLGAYQFLEDVLAAYDLEVHGPEGGARLRDVDPAQLPLRTRFGLSWGAQLARLPAEIWGLVVGMLIFFLGRPLALSRRRSEPPAEDGTCLLDQPAYHFTPGEFAGLKAAARRDGATLNDLMLRDAFRAIQTWQAQCGQPVRHGLVRIMLPMDLRSPGDERLPAVNVVAMVNLDRRPGWIGDWRRALRLLNWETWFLKRFRFGLSFIRGVQVCERLPGGLSLLCGLKRPYATAVLSNLGKVFEGPGLVRDEGRVRVGRARVERVESAPPVRRGTAAGISILSYAGRLGIALSYDRWHWSQADAQAFLDVLVATLRETGAEALAASETSSTAMANAARG